MHYAHSIGYGLQPVILAVFTRFRTPFIEYKLNCKMSGQKRSKKVVLTENMEEMDLDDLADSENEYSTAEKDLLRKVRTRRVSPNFDSDDEVYKLQNDDDNDDEDDEGNEEGDSIESDIEGLQENYDLPNERAWGKNKKAYYSTDYVDPDYNSLSQKDLLRAEIEEQEARSIQKRLAEQLDDADFGLDFIQGKSTASKGQKVNEHFVKADLTKLSKRQKQELIQQESPELMALVTDFKERLTEAKNILAPFLKLIENSSCPDCPGFSFIRTKYHLILNYCVNISFYLMLKAKRLPVNSHPVIKRLAQYRQLLTQLQAGQGSLLEHIQTILKTENESMPLYNVLDGSTMYNLEKTQPARARNISSNVLLQKRTEISISTCHDDSKCEEVEDSEKIESTSENEEEAVGEDNITDKNSISNDINEENEKRAITYQIAKNKGLTPYRKKEQRNPRVKHRNKYRKAKIRRKGAIREVRKEVTRYDGEISGIKASVKKSIKLK